MTQVQAFFDKLAPAWDQYNQEDSDKLRSMLYTAGLDKNARILDIGCGTGILFPYLLEYAPTHIDAVDVSSRMVKIAQKKNTDSRIHVHHADFYDLSENVRYHAAIIYNAYPHFLNKLLFVEKLYQLLTPGGRFILMHGSGRKTINGVHHGRNASAVSVPLRSCAQEAETFSQYFDIDVSIDTAECYLLSGRAKDNI